MIRVLQSDIQYRNHVPVELSEHLDNMKFRKTIYFKHPDILYWNPSIQSEFLGSIHCKIKKFTWSPRLNKTLNEYLLNSWRKRIHSRQVEHRWHYNIVTTIQSKRCDESFKRCRPIDDELDKRFARLLTGYVRDSHLSYWNLRHCPYVD
jgi:hypothetical protein